jgi:hypothetical protein
MHISSSSGSSSSSSSRSGVGGGDSRSSSSISVFGQHRVALLNFNTASPTFRERVKNVATSKGIKVGIECK